MRRNLILGIHAIQVLLFIFLFRVDYYYNRYLGFMRNASFFQRKFQRSFYGQNFYWLIGILLLIAILIAYWKLRSNKAQSDLKTSKDVVQDNSMSSRMWLRIELTILFLIILVITIWMLVFNWPGHNIYYIVVAFGLVMYLFQLIVVSII